MYSHHEKLPAFLDNLFKTNKSVHSCNTRSAANIHKKNKLWQIFRLYVLRKQLYGTTFPDPSNISSYNMLKKKVKEYVIKKQL